MTSLKGPALQRAFDILHQAGYLVADEIVSPEEAQRMIAHLFQKGFYHHHANRLDLMWVHRNRLQADSLSDNGKEVVKSSATTPCMDTLE